MYEGSSKTVPLRATVCVLAPVKEIVKFPAPAPAGAVAARRTWSVIGSVGGPPPAILAGPPLPPKVAFPQVTTDPSLFRAAKANVVE